LRSAGDGNRFVVRIPRIIPHQVRRALAARVNAAIAGDEDARETEVAATR
jgi:hypothetical protein